jgi:hypothetical protein
MCIYMNCDHTAITIEKFIYIYVELKEKMSRMDQSIHHLANLVREIMKTGICI